MFEGIPDRRKGMIVGIVGGLVGMYVMRRYVREVLPKLFPDANDPPPASNQPDPLEQHAPVGKLYKPNETVYAAAGRVGYTFLSGKAPRSAETRQLLADLVEWGVGLFLGMVYGATRTSTLPRDFSGSFFFGIRIWLGDEIIYPLAGLRPGPSRFSRRQHFARLTSYWVFTFVNNNLTRLLYRLFSPEDW